LEVGVKIGGGEVGGVVGAATDVELEVGVKIGGGEVGGVGAATGIELEVGVKIGGGEVGINEYEAIEVSLFGGCCTQP